MNDRMNELTNELTDGWMNERLVGRSVGRLAGSLDGSQKLTIYQHTDLVTWGFETTTTTEKNDAYRKWTNLYFFFVFSLAKLAI